MVLVYFLLSVSCRVRTYKYSLQFGLEASEAYFENLSLILVYSLQN